MADLSITPSSVRLKAGASVESGPAGVTIAAGELVYLDGVDNTIKLAEAGDVVAKANASGVAINSAGVGDEVVYAKVGDIDLGATLNASTVYVVSETAGKICPRSDLTTGAWVTTLGVPKGTSTLRLNITANRFQVP